MFLFSHVAAFVMTVLLLLYTHHHVLLGIGNTVEEVSGELQLQDALVEQSRNHKVLGRDHKRSVTSLTVP